MCSYNILLGRLFAEAARAVVARCGAEMASIAVIGSHGYIYKRHNMHCVLYTCGVL